MNDTIHEIAESLQRAIAQHESVVIAFSGGVDSAVVVAAAFRSLGDRAVAITGIGDAVAHSELTIARDVAKSIGIRHVEVSTREIDDANYVRNDARRCFYCKSNLYQSLRGWADANGFAAIMSGTNLDDLSDYRPGLQAATEHRVIAPLAELKIDKSLVRELARFFGLSIAEKPAAPCLASRIAYGQSVTPERLRSIEIAESFLVGLGFEDVRVRLHEGGLVRIELGVADLVRACDHDIRSQINARMKSLGFQYVTLD
ncbi:MAG: ATP-dependent sacrificial sulfur transferase LarE, partial [Pirellula sp.]